MNWTRPADLRAQLQKLWDGGELLASLLGAEHSFPRRLRLIVPSAAELSEHFDDARRWIAELGAMPQLRIVMREFNHRQLGPNAVPDEVWVDSLEAALALLGKKRESQRFSDLIALTARTQPRLLAWLARRPLRALELGETWPLLLDIVAWLQAHPRPGVYLRQVDIPGVHSKLIEAHRGVLIELLDLALPPEAIDASAVGASQFARRYGFCDKPLRVRFRMLAEDSDITLDAAAFARLVLNPDVTQVFITENEINYLSFPPAVGGLVIFGAGYGFEMLAPAAWLRRCRLHYWGDIDTHGFAILDQLRGQFAHAESFLMDRATLLAFEPLWGEEDKPTLRDLVRLNREEQALFDDLRDNRLRKRLRLEQEKIGFGWVQAALAALLSAPPVTAAPDLQ